MPANLFYSTGIPTVVLVLKKNKENKDVLFIDASKNFEKGKNQNVLRKEDIDKIIDTYKERKDVDKYAHVATIDEIKENDYNLNIPRYVDTFEPEPPVDPNDEIKVSYDANGTIKIEYPSKTVTEDYLQALDIYLDFGSDKKEDYCYQGLDTPNLIYVTSEGDFVKGYLKKGTNITCEGDLVITEYNKDRTFGYTDFWILPEGVSTVLNYANGIQKDGDAWYYYKDGVVDTSYTGLAKYNGSWWYVKNGKIDFSATTLCKYNGTWWYVKNGKVDFGSTTLCKYNGSWWYVSGGKVNFGATGLCKYNGTWWYVKNGKVDFGSTTLCKYNGSW